MAKGKLASVYIVDDSDIERSMLTEHLSKYKSLNVKAFSNGEYCLKEIIVGNLKEPDLILLDYFLDSKNSTSKDGLEILSKLRELSPDTKVIMLTGVSNEKVKELAKKKGAVDYVTKGPEGYQQLDDVLKKHFDLK
jgi:two-component system response regulator HydG